MVCNLTLHPPPHTERLGQIIKKLSDEVESLGLHTQRAVIMSVHASLFPEARMATEGKTLQGLYQMLSSSKKYRNHSECIFYFIVVNLLSLTMKDSERQILKERADSQSKDVLVCKEIKFLDLINFLSYESKESLMDANILQGSAKHSTEDTAELISHLIQTGHVAQTSASLVNLLKSAANNDLYKAKIKEVLDAPVWTAAKPATVNISSSQIGDLVVADSPQLPEVSPSKSLGAMVHSKSGWTAPVAKKIGDAAQHTSGNYLYPPLSLLCTVYCECQIMIFIIHTPGL